MLESNCQRLIIVIMPGPLPVLFGATAGTAPHAHAPILTMHGRDNYTFYSAGETYKIKSHITCNIFNVIYMIQCHLCIKFAIFWGKPNAASRTVFRYRRPIFYPSGSYIQTAVLEHFLSNSHSVSYMLLIPSIETLRHERDCLRKQVRRTSLIKPKPSSLWE